MTSTAGSVTLGRWTHTPSARSWVLTTIVVAFAFALIVGLLAAVKPKYAIGAAALVVLLVLAFRAPVAHMLLLLVVTAIVPLSIQSRYGTGGSLQSAGAIPSDFVLLAGLARAAFVLPGRKLNRRGTVIAALTCLVLLVATLQVLHALGLGRSISGVGSEFRMLLGLGTVLIALPLLDEPDSRRRLGTGLSWLGLVLGLWGIAQFGAHLQFDPATNIGGGGQGFNTAGRVVGMYAFPVAALVAMAVLSSGQVRSRTTRLLLLAVLATNLAALVLTFERTFLLALVVGWLVLIVRGTPRQRARMVVWPPVAVLSVLVALALMAPNVVSALGQRVSTLSHYSTDPSVTYRGAESQLVEAQIAAHPLTGAGFGATILIGRPGTNEPLAPRPYAEDGYLWAAWKLGIPGAALLCLMLLLPIAWRGSPREEPVFAAARLGAQAALAALAFATYAFPSFNQIAITPAIGLMLAACAVGPTRPSEVTR
jgi:hypothetical protein